MEREFPQSEILFKAKDKGIAKGEEKIFRCGQRKSKQGN